MKYEKITFEKEGPPHFLQNLKREVNLYFLEKNLSQAADGKLILKAIILFSLRIFLYGSILMGWYPFGLWGINWAFLGLVEILISFNVGHDAIHGAFSKNRTINKWLGYLSFDWIGLSSGVWKKTHNQEHHTFTNIPDADPDISKPFIIRLCPTAPHFSFHRFQHFYAWFLYSIVGINWVLYSDWACFFNTKKSWKLQDQFFFYFWKVFALCYFVVIPTWISPLSFTQVLLGYLIAQLVGGFTVSVVFQLAHLVEGVEFPEADTFGSVNRSWGEHEMRTTSNFATENLFVTHLFGGLNFQVEHHLFPQVSHGHYPALSKIVKSTCLKAGFPYYEKPGFFAAVASHTRFLRNVGKG